MRKMYKITALLLAALFALLVTGCKKDSPAVDDQPISDEKVILETGSDQSAEENKDIQNNESASDIKVDTAPRFDGIYKNDSITVVIRNADEEMCDFIISAGENGSDGYLSGIAQIIENEIFYETEIYGFSMTVAFDDLVLEETGKNTYYESGFKGTYTRTGDDPYAVEIRQSSGGNVLPDTIGNTVVNGEKAVLYVDPDNRFTATVPDVFSGAPEDAQPENGIHLISVEGDVDAVIEAVLSDVDSAEKLKQKMESEYDVEADLFVDGTVAIETACEDGSILVIFAHVIDGGVAEVRYMFDAAQESYFRTLLDQVSININ